MSRREGIVVNIGGRGLKQQDRVGIGRKVAGLVELDCAPRRYGRTHSETGDYSRAERFPRMVGQAVVTSEQVTSRDPAGRRASWYPSLFDLGLFAVLSGVLVLGAWMATTGRVMYTLVMLVIGGALAYAVLDLVDYEIVKRRSRG
jgi:hypothetical protein